MITLRKLALEIHRLLDGGVANADSQYDVRYTAAYIRAAMGEILQISYTTRRQVADDRSQERMYIATYPKITVDYDPTTERSYADLPDFYVSLPYNRGVHQVSSMDKPLDPMVQKQHPGVSRTLPAGKLQGRIGYYTEGLKIYWDEDISKKSVKKVMIKLVVPAPDSLALTDNLPITVEQQGRIIDRVLAWYKGEGVQDKVVDVNKDIGVKIQ